MEKDNCSIFGTIMLGDPSNSVGKGLPGPALAASVDNGNPTLKVDIKEKKSYLIGKLVPSALPTQLAGLNLNGSIVHSTYGARDKTTPTISIATGKPISELDVKESLTAGASPDMRKSLLEKLNPSASPVKLEDISITMLPGNVKTVSVTGHNSIPSEGLSGSGSRNVFEYNNEGVRNGGRVDQPSSQSRLNESRPNQKMKNARSQENIRSRGERGQNMNRTVPARGRGGKTRGNSDGGRGLRRGRGRAGSRNFSGRGKFENLSQDSQESAWDVIFSDSSSIASETNNKEERDKLLLESIEVKGGEASSMEEQGRGALSSETVPPGAIGLLEELHAYEASQAIKFEERLKETPQGRLQTKLKEISEHKKSLPIYSFKNDLIDVVRKNQVVILVGETSSGKSTQTPQYLVEFGFAQNGKKIGCTQPRRIAAISLAERVADELSNNNIPVNALGNKKVQDRLQEAKVGGLVGYAVRFDRKVSKETIIKYMSDGFLVKECATDSDFDGYSVIIIDEAHERTLHTDVCLGLIKRAVRNRSDLKVIISSATLEYEKLSKFFNDAPIFSISGRCYEVETIHELESETEPNKEYQLRVVDKVLQIHQTAQPGDILVFLPGKEELDFVRLELLKKDKRDLLIILCHSSLPLDEQRKIHDKTPPGHRKVVLATNIAETSITIDGIVYVVDSGFYKQNIYNPHTKVSSLVELPITKFHAIQRQGRAGRTCPGKCYRIYTESSFNTFKEAPDPDIERSNLDSVMLDLFAMGIQDPTQFDFIDKPPKEAVMESIIHLIELSALTKFLKLTELGKKMALLPVDPPLAKVLIESVKLGCFEEVVIIVAMLSALQHRSVFITSSNPKRMNGADQAKAHFDHEDGDHLSLLSIYDEWNKVPVEGREDWCAKNFLEARHLVEADNIKKQLIGILKNSGVEVLPRNVNMDPITLSQNIRKSFTAGYFRQLAAKQLGGRNANNARYEPLSSQINLESNECVRNKYVNLHQSSSLYNAKPKLVIFHEVSKNKDKKAYMRYVISIEKSWFKEYAKEFYEKAEKLARAHGSDNGDAAARGLQA